MKKVFLGGTCAGSRWRDALIPVLKMDYFNPVVSEWTEEAKKEEIVQRSTCDICLYIITPEMTGVYSIAEAVADSFLRPGKTVFAYTDEVSMGNFTKHQTSSLEMTGKMIEENGGKFFNSISEVAHYLNSFS